MGEVHYGATVMDWMEQERERGITITSAATTASGRHGRQLPRAPHQHHRHPGHVDFTIEVERSMRVLDGACMVYDAVAGCNRSRRPSGARRTSTVPRLAFITRWTGRRGLLQVLWHIKTRLKGNPVPIQIPIGAEEKFEGVIDLVRMKAIYWDDSTQGMKFEMRDVPANRSRRGQGMAGKDGRGGAEANDDLMHKYLEGTISRTKTSRRACASAPSRTRSCRCCAVPRSRTRACRRCSMP